ncbi:MAG: hypothetical protein JW384_04266 [Nitrosomonadaceae bacterium]|nr:hypothetical protein [Nitrosomonadaceae bacterium]
MAGPSREPSNQVTDATSTQLPSLCPSNSFRRDLSRSNRANFSTLSVDSDTGLLSLVTGLGLDELRHDHEWLSYQEPESHCTELGRTLRDSLGVRPDSRIGGISWKDAGLVRAIDPTSSPPNILYARERQCAIEEDFSRQTWFTDTIDIQEAVTNRVEDLTQPRLDLISARHILEHSLSIGGFLRGLATLVHPDGWVLIEVPDCERGIKKCNYSILWEEHRHYFTIDSLDLTLRKCGWRIVDLSATTVDGEAVLLALVQPPPKFGSIEVHRPASRGSVGRGRNFITNFHPCRARILKELRSQRYSGASLYILGANHTASTFIDLFGEPGIFTACLDDHPEKQGRYISSFDVPIIPIESTLESEAVCVLSAIHPNRRDSPEDRLLAQIGRYLTIIHVEDVFLSTQGC